MASQLGAITGKKRRGFYQTEMMNAQLPMLSQILAQKEQRRQRQEDVAFRQEELQFSKQAHKDQMAAQEKVQKTQMGLEAAKLGTTVGMSTPKTIGSLFNMQPSTSGTVGGGLKDAVSGLNLPSMLGAGLTGFGLSNLFKKKGAKFGVGAAAGGLMGLLGSGAGMGLESAIGGGLMGGLGGLIGAVL